MNTSNLMNPFGIPSATRIQQIPSAEIIPPLSSLLSLNIVSPVTANGHQQDTKFLSRFYQGETPVSVRETPTAFSVCGGRH